MGDWFGGGGGDEEQPQSYYQEPVYSPPSYSPPMMYPGQELPGVSPGAGGGAMSFLGAGFPSGGSPTLPSTAGWIGSGNAQWIPGAYNLLRMRPSQVFGWR